ncbi:hypothetical protein SPRG_00561 [Saprolegnia parasitica CBS 223.65]|uniref:EF-hand domain-containing protein n=1 Tax=Saprolegnia parasitica (strain CBS 223.65) TaxID=695850 RepID=A0A067CVE5_SAPPC|nr:hypothetical protein SPRG_00561 [Saprolegnia parasitica CBS 223.65]KDO34498.1 hypothetical protein SPRG_00561 [Saprolegnia parasitica CBS 223.65]|eukprot:XP_012194177.1 hypothetical protein SPRG_00561 [Saprolegnia parasitica CBS 223.65]
MLLRPYLAGPRRLPAMPSRRSFLSLPNMLFSPASALLKSHTEKRVVPFSCREMYDVVANVDAYASFLPFCVSSRVVRRPNDNVMEADLTVGFQIFTETYRSRVLMHAPHKILITSIESPTFKSIESEWSFREVSPTSCEVNFRVTFEVASILHSQALRLFFDDVARTQLNAFIGRTQKLQNAQRLAPPSVASPGFLEGKMTTTDLANLDSVYKAHATAHGKELHLDAFILACQGLQASSWVQASPARDDFGRICQNKNSALASALFSTFMFHGSDDPRRTRDWITFDEFAIGLYLTLHGSLEEKSNFLFHVIDTTGDGLISHDELTRAMRRRLQVVKGIFPMLLQEQIELQCALQPAVTTSANDTAVRDKAMRLGSEALADLIEEIEKDIPLAVDQIFLEAEREKPGFISLDEWCHMWQSHPELVEMMTIDGMKKMMQWAAVIQKPTDAPAFDSRILHAD